MQHSLDDYRAVMAALDVIEGSPVARSGGDLWLWAQETRRLAQRMRDRAEDMLFADHNRLGFESERESKKETEQPQAPPAIEENRGSALREAILSSGEPSHVLALRLGVSVARVGKVRREAGASCAFRTGSGLTAEQRREIATSRELTKVLAARHSVAESLVTKLRKSGGGFQG